MPPVITRQATRCQRQLAEMARLGGQLTALQEEVNNQFLPSAKPRQCRSMGAKQHQLYMRLLGATIGLRGASGYYFPEVYSGEMRHVMRLAHRRLEEAYHLWRTLVHERAFVDAQLEKGFGTMRQQFKQFENK